ncbi:MAG: ABC transporter ATP-binding protein [Lachnospiraceae bacterium]|nr:ABC transporter ATP-binding protein [Lachnospiraceae bacterium]
MVGEVAMDLIQPDMMADIVDNGVLKSDITLIVTVGIKMILTVILGGLSGIFCGVFANIAAQGFGNDLRKDLFAKIMNLSFEQTDKISTGSLVTRLTNDVTQVQNMVMMAVRGFVRNSIMFLGGIFMLYRQSPKFALVAACGLPFVVFMVVFFLKKASPLFAVVQKKLDGINNVMQETVAGARVVKAYVREEYELGRFDDANDALCTENLRVQTLLAFMSPCMNIVLNLCVVAVILVGGFTVKAGGTITPGNTMAAITYLAQILHGITFMANIFQTFSRAKASADRINEVLQSPDIITDGAGVKAQGSQEDTGKGEQQAQGSIEFKHVSFAYPESDGQCVLEDISFKVNPGETMAIIGATGSGKSSLVHLIPRFYDVTAGEVLVDGVNVKDYDLTDLREKIAIVLQKAELYSRSIEENIRWSKKDATPWEIKKAAEIAQADAFICNTTYGYYTPVTEGGHSLSGGQKQRISIARAILKKHEILIFDDSTSALDLKTEASLYRALQEECPDVTKIIIAQRIASIKGADRIAVLDNGEISAIGSHEELMQTSEIYRDIYRSQMKEGGEA